ncbi:MAG: phage shock protein PspA [Azospirillum sp.]|nr:phage shock protein PspA [Azospirillum sp.]
MGIFSRLTDIINANLNALLDRAEDPEKLVRLIIQEMEDTLVEVRSSTVKIIAEKKEIERRVAALGRERDDWIRKAEVALSRGREDLARGALVEKAKAAERTDALAAQLAPLDEALAKAGDDIARLQAKLADAKNRERAIAARRESAVNRVKVREKLHDTRITDAFARFEQVERKVDEIEGKAESYDLGTGSRRKSLAEEINELDTNDRVDRDLAELKARLAARAGGTPPHS